MDLSNNFFILASIFATSVIFYGIYECCKNRHNRRINQHNIVDYPQIIIDNQIPNDIIIHQNPIPPPYKEIDDDLISLPPPYQN